MTESVLHTLVRKARYEVLPTEGIVELVADHVAPGREITVTASAGLGLEATLETAERLSALGFVAVPHIAARMVHGRGELAEIVARLAVAGIDRIFVPAGDATPPAGSYPGALDLLVDLHSMAAPFGHIGITGYPEPHPLIPDDLVVTAMRDKQPYATHVVSNLCFDPALIGPWLSTVRDRGVRLPLLLGVAGRVEFAKLGRIATRIGVGESARFLRKNTLAFTRMVKPGGFNPRKLLERLSPAFEQQALGVAGLHIYTFNQVRETEEWRRRELRRLEAMSAVSVR